MTKLIVISAPSGAGKTSIVQYLLQNIPQIVFSISACSREKRKNEIDGEDYYFLTTQEFKEKIKNKEFIEWEEVYKDQFYGTLKSEITRAAQKSKAIIFDVDVIGGLNIKKQYAEECLAIFIMPPTLIFIITLAAALPSGSQTYYFSYRYNAIKEIISANIVISTFVSFITIPIILFLFGY